MKKKVIILLLALVIILATGSVILSGCKPHVKLERFNGVDLTEKATVTASDNTSKANNLIDNGNSAWTTKKQSACIEITFDQALDFNTVVLSEPTDSVKRFEIHIFKQATESYEMLYTQDRIDNYRMCAFENVKSSKIKIIFNEFDKKVSITNLEVYNNTGSKQSFVRQAYMNSSIEADTNLTTIQTRKDDPDFASSLNVLTDVILIGLVTLTENATFVCANGIDSLKDDIKTLRDITDGRIRVHLTIMTGLKSEFNQNNKAMVKLAKDKMADFKINLRTFVEDVNPDGIDYDWEYPQLAWEWSAYSDILIATKAVISGRQLSVALWPYGVNLSKEARAVIDKVNIMAYDQFDNRGDHSPIYDCGLGVIEYFAGLGFSKNQMLLGIPFYGRTTDKKPQWPLWEESYGKWNNCKQEYTYTDNDGQHNSSIYINGYAMVRDKTALAIAYDLAGIMIFSFNCDTTYSYEYSLHRAVEFTIHQRLDKVD